MTEPEFLLETAAGEPAMETSEAPHSWDPSGRNAPATKLDWTECLPFRQVRGVEVASDPERPLQGSAES
jgi:hypothetical protein